MTPGPARLAASACLGLALLSACGDDASSDPGPRDDAPAALPGEVAQRFAPDVLAALRAALEAVQDDASEPQPWLALGMTYEAHGLLAEAAGAYAQAEARSPTPGRAAFHAGRALAAAGDTEAALAAWERAHTGAADHAPLHWRRGTLLLEAGRLDEAEAAFQRAAQLEPQGFAGVLGLARVALARDDHERVLALLQPWAIRHPEQGEIQHLMGRAHRAAGRLTAAQEALARWDGRVAPRPDAWTDEVQTHRAGYLAVMDAALDDGRAGRTGEAIATLARLHAESPDDMAVLEKLVLAYREAGEPDAARRVLQEVLRRDASHYRAWFALAEVDEQRGDLRAALNAVGQCLQRQPSFVRGHELAARLLWKGGDMPGAALALADALVYGGPDVGNLRKLARARILLEQWDDALVALRQAIDLAPDDPTLRVELLDVQLQQLDFPGASETLLDVESWAPEHPDVQAARERFDEVMGLLGDGDPG